MTDKELNELFSNGQIIPYEAFLAAQEQIDKAARITMEINSHYHTTEELNKLFSELTGREVTDITIRPPFSTDYGKNIKVGHHVSFNSGVCLQDHGGITIGDGCQIGQHVVIATLNHNPDPAKRHQIYGKPIVLGKNVWVGANVVITQGVTIGDGAIIAAGAVVTRNVEPNTLVGGVPEHFIRKL